MDITVVYGELNNANLNVVTVKSVAEAKKLAIQFIKVVPDDIDEVIAEINAWNGEKAVDWYHQDDDFFYISLTPVRLSTQPAALKEFKSFVEDYEVADEDDSD